MPTGAYGNFSCARLPAPAADDTEVYASAFSRARPDVPRTVGRGAAVEGRPAEPRSRFGERAGGAARHVAVGGGAAPEGAGSRGPGAHREARPGAHLPDRTRAAATGRT